MILNRMKKITIFLFKFFYKLFNSRFGSDDMTSNAGAISLTILVYSFFIIFLGNFIILHFFKFNIIKETNEWIRTFFTFLFYIIFYYIIKRQIKSVKI